MVTILADKDLAALKHSLEIIHIFPQSHGVTWENILTERSVGLLIRAD